MTSGHREDDARHSPLAARETPEPSAEGRAPSAEGRAPSAETGEAAATEVAADLDALLADVTRERDEYLALAQRAKADFDNYRKRAAREAAEAERRGKATLARELLPSIDDLERALSVAEGGNDVTRGVELVHGQLQTALGRAGVEAYDPIGETFDPTVHEAIATRPADGVEAGTVVETLERGYRLDGQLVRPARVVVSE